MAEDFRDLGTENPPHASALVEAMRSIGYTPSTALADLIDNSVTAKAKYVQVRVSPSTGGTSAGFVSVDDDGDGMSASQLVDAMRWGGEGPEKPRRADDLGRFGLGLKTASFSMGRCLTVASRPRLGELTVLRWDLDHVAKAGWRMLPGPDPEAAEILKESRLTQSTTASGTVVIVTRLDRLQTGARIAPYASRNLAALTQAISEYLGMAFHRFLDDGLEIRLGASKIPSWDPFEGAEQKARETIGDNVEVSSFLLPHHSRTTEEQDQRIAGPLGWGAHQGYLVYRQKRLIVPGGWLRLFQASDACRLARVRVDLPNAVDAGWKLNVMKSTVAPPSWQVADLNRIGEAIRRQSMAVFGFRGERQAPTTGPLEDASKRAFWSQFPTKDSVTFRINRAHALVQTLKQVVREPSTAEEFLRAFERLLPIDAIIQDPRRTTNGMVSEPSADDFSGMASLADKMVGTLVKQGYARAAARRLVLESEPFAAYAVELDELLRK